MKEFKCNEPIEVLGVSFNGVREMIKAALNETPKDGVYVGIDCERYPCFDDEDIMNEDRYFMNIVFARSEEELQRKLEALDDITSGLFNYNKLTGELHPMAYWRGDDCFDVCLSEADDE